MKKYILVLLLVFSIGCSKKEEKSIKEIKPMKEETKIEKNNYVSYNGNLKVKDTNLVNQYDEIIQLRGIIYFK